MAVDHALAVARTGAWVTSVGFQAGGRCQVPARDHRLDARQHARAVSAAALAVTLGIAGAAAAQPIELAAPAECGDAAALSDHVVAYLGRAVQPADELEATVEVAQDAGTSEYVATIRVTTKQDVAERQVRGLGCPEVIDAAAFVLAMTVQDTQDAHAAAPPAAPPPIVARQAPPGRRFHGGARLGGELEGGALPRITPGVSLTGNAWLGGYGIEIGGVAYAPTRASAGADDIGVDVDLIAGRLRGCGATGALRLCGGGEIGRMHGEGVGLTDARSVSRRWSAVSVGVGWSRALGPLSLFAEIDVVLGVERPRFTLDDGTPMHAPERLSGYLSVGLALDVPRWP